MENTAARKRKQVPEGYLIIGIDPHKKGWGQKRLGCSLNISYSNGANIDPSHLGQFLLRRQS